ncbi:MAG TPA: GlsB/YeaQ/YmgE family stress response membrane protein [Rhizomicrobium sp.]|nr:GlsB/YeaQ/YmgE family stress response membrane protein [Rhizomicrobium sp.]
MSILGWILLGLIAGFVASKAVNDKGEGCLLNIALGLVGAMVGGFIFTSIGGHGVGVFSLYSMFVAIIGAVVVLFLWHAVTGQRGLR